MDKLDLNNLIPDSAEVTIGDETLTIKPASLRSLFIINKAAQLLQDTDSTPERMEKTENELRAELIKLVPGLEKHEINGMQLLALSDLVATMSTPKDDKGGDSKVSPKVPSP